MKEVDKELARAVVDTNEQLNDIFDELDSASEFDQLTPAEVQEKTEAEEEV